MKKISKEERLLRSIFRGDAPKRKGPKRTPSLKAHLRVRQTSVRRKWSQTRQMARLRAGNRSFWGLSRKGQPGRYKRWKASRKPKRETVDTKKEG